jgi:excisionase family DNA binding protein
MPNKYTTGEVGQLLGLTRQTILRRINKGLLPCYRDPHSGYYYVLRTDVEAYARNHNLPLFPLKKATAKPQEIEAER